jgi:hypothetical protein
VVTNVYPFAYPKFKPQYLVRSAVDHDKFNKSKSIPESSDFIYEAWRT